MSRTSRSGQVASFAQHRYPGEWFEWVMRKAFHVCLLLSVALPGTANQRAVATKVRKIRRECALCDFNTSDGRKRAHLHKGGQSAVSRQKRAAILSNLPLGRAFRAISVFSLGACAAILSTQQWRNRHCPAEDKTYLWIGVRAAPPVYHSAKDGKKGSTESPLHRRAKHGPRQRSGGRQ